MVGCERNNDADHSGKQTWELVRCAVFIQALAHHMRALDLQQQQQQQRHSPNYSSKGRAIGMQWRILLGSNPKLQLPGRSVPPSITGQQGRYIHAAAILHRAYQCPLKTLACLGYGQQHTAAEAHGTHGATAYPAGSASLSAELPQRNSAEQQRRTAAQNSS